VDNRNRFFRWEIIALTRPLIIEFAAEHFPGESIVLHTKNRSFWESWFVKWYLVHFEHRVIANRCLSLDEGAKFMPQFPHYRLRRLASGEYKWHICQVSSVKQTESTWPLPDGRAEEEA